jgi:hypothetical protein
MYVDLDSVVSDPIDTGRLDPSTGENLFINKFKGSVTAGTTSAEFYISPRAPPMREPAIDKS